MGSHGSLMETEKRKFFLVRITSVTLGRQMNYHESIEETVNINELLTETIRKATPDFFQWHMKHISNLNFFSDATVWNALMADQQK